MNGFLMTNEFNTCKIVYNVNISLPVCLRFDFVVKVRGYVRLVYGVNILINSYYFNVLRLQLHQSFYVNVNNFVFLNMTSFGNKRRCLTTIAHKPCFVLNVIHLIVRGVCFFKLMYLAELPLVCYTYIYFTFSLPYSCNGRLTDL